MCLLTKLLTVAFQRKRETNLKPMVCVTVELCSSQIKMGEKLNPAQHCNYLIGEIGNNQIKVNVDVAKNNFLNIFQYG